MNDVAAWSKNLSLGFDPADMLFRGLSFELKFGEVLLLKGGNGSGKSTLLRTLLGKKPRQLNGSFGLAEVPTGHVPQVFRSHFHTPCRLEEVVFTENPNESACFKDEWPDFSSFLSKDVMKTAWQKASGGEKQKAVFLRTLLQKPQILLLDEPANHLDQKSIPLLWKHLEKYILAAPEKRAAIVVSHEKSDPDFSSVSVQIVQLDALKGGG